MEKNASVLNIKRQFRLIHGFDKWLALPETEKNIEDFLTDLIHFKSSYAKTLLNGLLSSIRQSFLEILFLILRQILLRISLM